MSKLNQLKAEGKVNLWLDFRRNSLLDYSGNDNVATPAGTPSWQNTDKGRSVYFIGNGRISVADSASVQVTSGVLLVFGKFEDQTQGARIISNCS